MLTLRARVDLEAMAMKGYSEFPMLQLLKTYHHIVLCHIQGTRLAGGGVLPFCKDVIGVFSSPSRLDQHPF